MKSILDLYNYNLEILLFHRGVCRGVVLMDWSDLTSDAMYLHGSIMQQHIQCLIQLQQTVDKPIMGMLLTSWVSFSRLWFCRRGMLFKATFNVLLNYLDHPRDIGRLMLPAAGGAIWMFVDHESMIITYPAVDSHWF